MIFRFHASLIRKEIVRSPRKGVDDDVAREIPVVEVVGGVVEEDGGRRLKTAALHGEGARREEVLRERVERPDQIEGRVEENVDHRHHEENTRRR